MYSPILEHEAQQKHQGPQSVIYDLGRNLLFPGLCPYPLKHGHGYSVDNP